MLDHCNAPFVLLDDSRVAHRAGPSYLFHSPKTIIKAETADQIAAALTAIDKAVADGFHVAGWISYEVAGAFEPRLAHLLDTQPHEPYIWMLVTEQREKLTSDQVAEFLEDTNKADLRTVRIHETQDAYSEALEKILQYIKAGDVYQINHTFPLDLQLDGSSRPLYGRLRKAQPVPYGAYIETGEQTVLSLSPELFIKRTGNTLEARPMKGTAPRGRNTAEDQEISNALVKDAKSQAENLMIVDLIRNDLSRLAQPGSVSVPELFTTERYPTLHQMTSTVLAEAKNGLTPSQLLKAIFPCGSVTGAPKVRAMQIIDELENEARGIYCGAIGHFSPANPGESTSWTLNVPIRTVRLKGQAARFNVGSGIVADSDISEEYQECLLKASFLENQRAEHQIIETMRFEDGRIFYQDDHIKRLLASCAYFDFAVTQKDIADFLADFITNQKAASAQKIRLLARRNGKLSAQATDLPAEPYAGPQTDLTSLPQTGSVCLSPESVDSSARWLFHKTTNRSQYDQSYKQAVENGHLDMLFVNEKGKVTEGAISNLFVRVDGSLFTPPLEDGLLPGVFRKQMLQTTALVERSITLRELETGELFLGSAVRGLRKVTLVK